MFDRVGKGIRSAPRDALIASSVDQRIRGKAYGFHRAMDHAGAVVGPLLALFTLALLILGFGMKDTLLTLRWTFCLSIIPGMFAVVTVVFFVKEKVDTTSTGKPFKFSLKQFNKNFIAYLSIVFLFTLGNSYIGYHGVQCTTFVNGFLNPEEAAPFLTLSSCTQ